MIFNLTNKIDLVSLSKRTEFIDNDNDYLIGTEVKDNTTPLILDTQIKEKRYLSHDGKFVTEEEYPKFVR